MKRSVTVLLILSAITIRSQAVKRVTVAQLEQLISISQAKQDSDLAYQIGDVQLTERLSETAIARLYAALPGERSRQALTAIAAASEFQAPPAGEGPVTAAPDLAGQRRIMGLVADYVIKTIPQLPNFSATRTTTRFEDTPLLQRSDAFFTPYEPLHQVSVSSVTVFYRDGREVEESLPAKTKSTPAQGLSSSGEFGPMLSAVLLDAAKSKLVWSHWENGPAGLQAVFRYEVPREKSHYEVNYCCVAEEAATVVANTHPFLQITGYHGEMAVDPAVGTILRLSLQADLKPGSPLNKADILVNYGPVEIGGKTYICPVNSVSMTIAQMVQHTSSYSDPVARQIQPLKTMLNDVKFKNYHVFRAESRVLTADAGQKAAPTASAQAVSPSAAAAETSAAANVAATPESPAVPPPPALAAASAETASPAPAPQPEISEAGNNDVPNAPAPGFTLRTTTRLVGVGLIAYDKQGQPVTDLKQSNFEIYDNGRKQEIKGFEQAGRLAAPASSSKSDHAAAAPQELVYSNREAQPTLQQRLAKSESHVTVLLIDASNLAWGDLSYAREEMVRFLKAVQADEQVGLYIMHSYGFQVLLEPNTDHAELAAQLNRWMPTAQDLVRAQEAEQRNRQHIDWVHSASDLAYVNGNDETDPSTFYSGLGQATAAGVDPQLRKMGNNPQRDALFTLQAVARHLAVIPGHKSLVWISSDNALADWRSQTAERQDKGNNFVDPIALHTREALNEAQVSIYPLDASQLEGGAITADLENRLVQAINPPRPGDPPPPPPNPTGRYAAQMHQDTHAIQGTGRELAEATGGRALQRAGDIAAELNGIAKDGRAVYLMSFTPDSPADDQYHMITVKLAGRRDLTLRYRTGYLYEREPATLKERFYRAVWLPRDVNEVGISATPAASGKDRTLKLTIAATDLEMVQLDGLWTDKLDIFVIDRDDSAQHAKSTSRTLALQLRSATYQRALNEGISVEQRLPARQGTGSVRILVVDENSGRIGSITVPN